MYCRHLISFEPGSLALAAYVLHRNMIPFKRSNISCKRMKHFIKRHKHRLLDVALDEIADPTLDFVNQHSHLITNYIPSSYSFALYLLILVITILLV